MNCEQVEEQLSAYLDNMLAPAERRDVTLHLQACPTCMASLAELRQNDIFLARLPRVGPSPALRARLFALPEVRDLSVAVRLLSSSPSPLSLAGTQPLVLSPDQSSRLSGQQSYPRLAAWSGTDQGSVWDQSGKQEVPPTPPTVRLRPSSSAYETRQFDSPGRRKGWFTPLKIALAAVIILALGAAGLLSLSLRRQASSANLAGAITPPAGPASGQTIPLAAGSRFVFLRNGALWSTLVDGSIHQPERLTPPNVVVAPGWSVDPLRGNHSAGDLLAYIDLQSGRVHTIRSDGQQDRSVNQALLPATDTAVWQSADGQIILNGLAWSPDSKLLAFVADPTGNGRDGLYLLTLATGAVQAIATNLTGSAAHPVWSPDGTRLAFTLTNQGVVSVLDYNVQSHSALDLSNLAPARGDSATNAVLSLGWFANGGQEAVTWCLGSIGHVRSLWLHRVGADGTMYPQQLVSGDYLQALYSAGSNNATGGWLLVASVAGRAGDVWRLDLMPGGQFAALSQGKQISFVRWSPDGSTVFYLDSVSNGLGNGHVVNILTGADQLLPDQVVANPAPDWSADGQQLAYSTGTQIDIVSMLNGGQLTRLSLQGQITDLSWSPGALHQLIVSLRGTKAGLYLVDTRQNTALQLDSTGTSSDIQWTEIP